jgi:hypothetical protein
MKRISTIALMAFVAIGSMAQAAWNVRIGGIDYPMTLIPESSPATYTATVTCEVAVPGTATNFYAQITDGTNTSNNVTTSFTLTQTKDVQFWGQYPSGKSWIAGLCSEMGYPIANAGWMYLCLMPSTTAAADAKSITYFNSHTTVSASGLKSALGSKSPSDIYWITANSTGNPPFGMTVNSSAAGIKKITLDYSKWAISVDEATSVDVTIGDAGASTLCAPADLTIPSGVKAYTLEYVGSALQAHEVTTTIPANTPVLLNAAAGNYSFAITGDASIGTGVRSSKTYYPDVTTTNNNLHGVLQMHYVPENSYVLSNGSEGVGFYKVTATNVMIPPFRAYVTVPAAVEAHSLSIAFDGGGTTGIADVNGKKEDVRSDIFNLSGQRVGNDFRGIVVKNGRKYIQK